LPNCWRPIFLILPKLYGCQVGLPNCWSCSKREKERKKKIKKEEEGYYGHSLISSTFHNQEKLFCQTFLQKGFGFTRESASPTQPQPELPQPQLCQTDPKAQLRFSFP
jgi:hypothetical protein